MPDGLHSPADGATPLTPEERDGLIPTYIATREDLNAAEEDNITEAILGLRRRRLTPAIVLDDVFVRALHKAMFGTVWRWAGTYRFTERNIGIEPHRIAIAVRDLSEDARYWVRPDLTCLTRDQAVCRVHHRLVAIHPFPNGNGRHARAYADALMRALGGAAFTWGAGQDLLRDGPDRRAYLDALRAADRDPEDVDALVAFARS
jgi:Fic-DOC domain mobile mystery protein B